MGVSLLAATLAAGAAPPPEQLDRAARELGDPKLAVREAATRTLFAAGMAAMPALGRATHDDDPEIRLRAERVLGRFSRGIFADTPADVAEMADRYPVADEAERHNLVGELAKRGGYGYVVLIKLAEREEDLWLKGWINQVLGGEGTALTQTAAVLMQRGDADAAERLLATGAETGNEPAVRAYAALLADQGKIAAKIAELRVGFDRGEVGYVPRALMFLYRAAGDLPSAMAVAEKANDHQMAETFALEGRDWKKLAELLSPEPEKRQPDLNRLGVLAVARRLGGDADGFAKTLDRVMGIYRLGPGNYWPIAAVLLLNDRADDATRVFIEQQRYLPAFEFLVFAGKFDEALALLQRARADGHPDATRIAAKSAQLLWRLGESDQSRGQLASIAPKAMGDLFAVAEVEREIGRTDPAMATKAATHLTAALRQASGAQWAGMAPPDLRGWLNTLYPDDSAAAQEWWSALRPSESATAAEWDDAVATLEQVLGNHLPAARWESIIAKLYDPAIPASNGAAQMRRLELLTDALDAAAQPALAAKCFEHLREIFAWSHGVDRSLCLYIPRWQLKHGQWKEAAESIEICSARYGETPDLLWLGGWALHQSGDAKLAEAGDAAMARAPHRTLGDETRTMELADMMADHAHPTDAIAVRAQMFRFGPPRGLAYYGTCWRLAVDLAATDPAAAADYWQRYGLVTLDTGSTFSRDLAYLEIPRHAHLHRARAFAKAGKGPEAMAEFNTLARSAPLNIETALAAVPELRKLGMESTARGVFDLAYKPLETFLSAHPRAAYYHNEIAWLAVRCGYEPAAAMSHAARAVELQPGETNNLDTLAEAYFRGGNPAKAVELMRQCETLEPAQPRHRQRREAFESGKAE